MKNTIVLWRILRLLKKDFKEKGGNMKKLLVLAALLVFSTAAFAAPKCKGDECPVKDKAPRHEMLKKGDKADRKAKMDAAKAERKARKAQFKANEEKLEKLVKEYKKAKEGSKKQASAREEIGEVLNTVRDEQIEMRSEQIKAFEKRLADMREALNKEQEPAAKNAWIEKMTDKVIAEDGDLGEALRSYGHMPKGPRAVPEAGPKGHRGPEAGPKGPHAMGPDGELPPPPPAPAEAE